MKITLVNPPCRLSDVPRNFPTGLALIAAVLLKEGHEIHVVDANAHRMTVAEALDAVAKTYPNVVGIGGLITTYKWVKNFLKSCSADWKTIAGGSVVSSIPKLADKFFVCDHLVFGEGEYAISEIIDSGENRFWQLPLLENLDELPLPAWNLFDMEGYLNRPKVGVGRDMDVISSRGCPYGCHFCYHAFGKKWRARSPNHVLWELETLKKDYEVDFISFQDDCFVIDKKRVYEICDNIEKSEILKGLKWSCTGRVGVVDISMLERMKKAGCVSVSYGIESGSDTLLAKMGKAVTSRQAADTIRWTREAGMRAPVSFMIGYPGETDDTIRETVDFCIRNHINLQNAMFVTPYPGTDLWKGLKYDSRDLERQESIIESMDDAIDLSVNVSSWPDTVLKNKREDMLKKIQLFYELTEHPKMIDERTLYGPELYDKWQQQLNEKEKEHRKNHGFNE